MLTNRDGFYVKILRVYIFDKEKVSKNNIINKETTIIDTVNSKLCHIYLNQLYVVFKNTCKKNKIVKITRNFTRS